MINRTQITTRGGFKQIVAVKLDSDERVSFPQSNGHAARSTLGGELDRIHVGRTDVLGNVLESTCEDVMEDYLK